MSSTRFKNDPIEYKLEQQVNHLICNNRVYEGRNVAYEHVLPDAGIYVSHMPNYILSNNATDVESSLYGIGSSNLVEPKTFQQPQSIYHASKSFFDRPITLMPEPFVHQLHQRPVIP